MGNDDEKKSRKRHRSSRSRSRTPVREKGDKKKEHKKEKRRHKSRSRSRSRSRSHEGRKNNRDRDREKGREDKPKEKSSHADEHKRLAAIISKRVEREEKTEEDSKKEREKQRDAEQAQLDEEMRKRKERVKAWQEARKAALKQGHDNLENSEETSVVEHETKLEDDGTESRDQEASLNDKKKGKGNSWSLEDDDEDDVAVDEMTTKDTEETFKDISSEKPPPSLNHPPNSNGSSEASETNALFDRPTALASAVVPPVTATTIGIKLSSTVPSTQRAVSGSSRFAKQKSGIVIHTTNAPVLTLKTSKPTGGSQVAESSPLVVTAAPSAPVDDIDPLDSFMSELLSTEAVAAQVSTPMIPPGVPHSTVIPNPSMVPSGEGIVESKQDADEAADADMGGEEEANLESMTGKVITWEEILGSLGGGTADNDGESNEASQSIPMDVAESKEEVAPEGVAEAVGSTGEEDREEKERKAFMEALRRSHLAESAAEDAATEAEAGADKRRLKQENDLGRVFAGEGDVADEIEIETKKKSALELLEEAKKGKELKPVDHAAIEYPSFRKNLYIVPRALARLSETEVKDKRDLLSIKVRGKGCPVPVDTWEQCGLSERMLKVIEKYQFQAPFAIQKQAIPAIMCGRDVIAVAKTGSGKTLAFLLPMFRHIQDQPPLKDGETGPVGLIMAPARELAFQIYNEAKKFTKALGLRVACIYGGAGVAEQIAELKRGADIVVCTPGRMIDILTMQAGKLVALRRVTMVVLDEADRMFDMGFEPQIRMIIQNIRPDRQTVLFSATFPKQIEKLAKGILKLPLEIVVGEKSMTNSDITQFVEVHEEDDKFMRLLQLLGVWYEKGSILIFVDRQEKCDQLFQDLLKSGYPCLSLHGGKDQIDRDSTLHEFKSLIKTVMVATGVAGRGLDVKEIVCVINYNCPNHLEDYVHRIGRTGRAGRHGTAYTFLSPQEEQYSPTMVKVLEKTGQPVPQELQAMAANFKAKVERGEAQWSSTGVRQGSGYLFDGTELNESQKLANMQRRQYEIEQGIYIEGEPEEDVLFAEYEDNSDEEGGAETATNDRASLVAQAAATVAALAGGSTGTTPSVLPATDTTAVPAAPPMVSTPVSIGGVTLPISLSLPAPSSNTLTPLERARALAASLGIGKTPAPSSAPGSAGVSSSGAVGVLPPPPVTSDGKVDAKAALARAKLIAMQMAGGGKGEEGKEAHFSDEFEINDYPVQARRKVTNRLALDEVTERTGVAIISRGSYVPPGKKLEPGERKLYLLIEGSNEMQVKQARMEIQRQLDEETIRVSGLSGPGGGSQYGRYSVL